MTETQVVPSLRQALNGKRVYVAGHTGMAGSALVRRLKRESCEVISVGRAEVDLRKQTEVDDFMAAARPDIVIVAAARVGGIVANNNLPVDFLADNLSIQLNLITSSHRSGVERLLFLGSTCVYPRDAVQPLNEDSLLSGALEQTNEWYAVAKIAGIKLCQAYRRQFGRHYISVMPTNLYGPGDNYHPVHSHVVASLVRRFHDATVAHDETVTVWGTGTPRREFLHVDDFADACIFLLGCYNDDCPINIGIGCDVSISELASMIGRITGFRGRIVFDATKPDGTPRKLVDVGRLSSLGWRASIGLETGLTRMYEDFRYSSVQRREV